MSGNGIEGEKDYENDETWIITEEECEKGEWWKKVRENEKEEKTIESRL